LPRWWAGARKLAGPTLHRLSMALGLLWMGCSVASAWQAADKNDDEQAAAAAPQLRLEAGGPTAFVTSLAFSPASDTLLIGGWDKLVDVWRAAPQGDRRWQRDAAGAFRIPIGPETWGAINAVAISPDGEQLAVGGKALARGVGDWQHPGWLVPTLGLVEEGLDRGTIYVFDVRTRQVRQLRGHRGVIWALAYVSPGRDRPRCLVSAAAEPDPADSSKSWMVVRVWNAAGGDCLVVWRWAEGDRRGGCDGRAAHAGPGRIRQSRKARLPVLSVQCPDGTPVLRRRRPLQSHPRLLGGWPSQAVDCQPGRPRKAILQRDPDRRQHE
ncbi:MAG TPA: hypothetical protein PK867_14580, partial [Pirellulales bacterium]|nr:hypothetical protein [Pirellulales bacterium]